MLHPGMKSFRLMTFSEGSIGMKKWESHVKNASSWRVVVESGQHGGKGVSQLLLCPGLADLGGELWHKPNS